jgi:hypothetical protein
LYADLAHPINPVDHTNNRSYSVIHKGELIILWATKEGQSDLSRFKRVLILFRVKIIPSLFRFMKNLK